jgi:hypothetical protein
MHRYQYSFVALIPFVELLDAPQPAEASPEQIQSAVTQIVRSRIALEGKGGVTRVDTVFGST